MEHSKTVEVYVASIKPIDFELPSYCRKIQVNAEANGQIPGYLHDNDNPDNISRKNPNYSELTALYSMWKNCTADIQGLYHYRRYLADRDVPEHSPYLKLRLQTRASRAKSLILTEERITAELEKADLIAVAQVDLEYTNVLEMFRAHVYWKDIRELYRLLEEKYPEYYDAFCNVMSVSRRGVHPANMFISERKFVDEYCSWLFGILSQMESRISLEGYSTQRKRIYGYFSEVLFEVYIRRHNLKVKSFPMLFVNNETIPLYMARKIPGLMSAYCSFRDRAMRKLARLNEFLENHPDTESVRKYILRSGASEKGKFLLLEAREKIRLAGKLCAVYMPRDESDNFLPELYEDLREMESKAASENLTLLPRIILSSQSAGNVRDALFDAGVRILEY